MDLDSYCGIFVDPSQSRIATIVACVATRILTTVLPLIRADHIVFAFTPGLLSLLNTRCLRPLSGVTRCPPVGQQVAADRCSCCAKVSGLGPHLTSIPRGLGIAARQGSVYLLAGLPGIVTEVEQRVESASWGCFTDPCLPVPPTTPIHEAGICAQTPTDFDFFTALQAPTTK